MKTFAMIFPLMVFGLVFGVQNSNGQNTRNADLHPPYLPEEELAISDWEEDPVLEEGEDGEIIERGTPRFKLKKNTRPRITIPKNPRKKTTPIRKFKLRPDVGEALDQQQQQQSLFDPQAYYRLTTEWQGPGRSLDIINDGENNKPILANTGNFSGQSWRITPLGTSGYYRLTTEWQGPGRSLDIINDGENNKPILANTGNFSGQSWRIIKIGGGGDQPVVIPPDSQCAVKTSDIAMNPMIDIGFENKFQSSLQNPNDSSAQQSLMRMMSRGNFQERAAASGMVQAIKQARLSGIFRTDKQAAWKKARGFAGQFIPVDENAKCFTTPAGEPPMIIYRNIRFPPSVFDKSLVQAWNQCGLPTPNPPCEYIRDMGNKQPVQPGLPPLTAGLTILVTSNGVPLEGASVGAAKLEKTSPEFADSKTTGNDGIVTFNPPGARISVWVSGPTEEFGLASLEVDIEAGVSEGRIVELNRHAPPTPPECDKSRWEEIFNQCGGNVLGGAIKCLADAYKDFFSCKGNPSCTFAKGSKFLVCRDGISHKKEINKCVAKANAETNCSFPGVDIQ